MEEHTLRMALLIENMNLSHAKAQRRKGTKNKNDANQTGFHQQIAKTNI
ncbi:MULTISPECIES: hypothetical protein [unclassified Nodularia (in: cyanobacteria)]|nr:hypothetical protein [Nodularia sp. LEGE 04288]MCC2691274.1 hypothetical protein [Nodularia sp. LEGE 04288]